MRFHAGLGCAGKVREGWKHQSIFGYMKGHSMLFHNNSIKGISSFEFVLRVISPDFSQKTGTVCRFIIWLGYEF